MSTEQLRRRSTLDLLDHDCGVYRLTVGGRVYVGATRRFREREEQHLKALHGQRHHSFRLQRAWEEAGCPADLNFTVLERTPLDRIGAAQEHWIATLGAATSGLNDSAVSTLKPGAAPIREGRGQPDPNVTPAVTPAITPRAGQAQALKVMLGAYGKGTLDTPALGGFTMPCGTGKTLLAALLAEHTGRILFITHTDELVDQAVQSMMRAWPGRRIGVIQRGEWTPDEFIVVASARTLGRRLERLAREHFDVVICDEAHLFGSADNTLILSHFRARARFGISATMHRRNGTGLKVLFGRELYRMTHEEAVEQGVLCPMQGLLFEPDFGEEDLTFVGSEASNAAVMLDTAPMNRRIAQDVQTYAAGKRTLVYASSIEHAGHLTRALLDLGISAAVVTGDDAHRAAKITAFRKGELQVLVNVNVVSYGFDVPATEVVVLAYVSRSPVRVQQNTGRAGRAAPGKTRGLVLDYGGNYARCLNLPLPFEMNLELLPVGPGRNQSSGPVTPDLGDLGDSGVAAPMRVRELGNAYGSLWEQDTARSANQEQRELMRQAGITATFATTQAQAQALLRAAKARPWQLAKLRELGRVPEPEWGFIEARAELRRLTFALN